MNIRYRIDRWCLTLGILAVGVVAFGITHKGAPKGKTESNRTGSSKAAVSPVKARRITAGPRIQAADVPTAPPVRAYRTKTVVFEARLDLPLLMAERVDERGAGIAAPRTGGPTGCELDEECDPCTLCYVGECIAEQCIISPVPEGTPCDDGLFCNGIELCDEFGICNSSDEPPCANRLGYICDEEARPGLCVLPCQDNSECDDGLDCNGVEVCVPQECLGGSNPGAPCTFGGGECLGGGHCAGVCRSSGNPCGRGASCQEGNPPTCGKGRCCTGTGYADCSRETLAVCTGTWLGVGGDEATCDQLAPPWGLNAGEDFRCPRYEGGIVQGNLIEDVGPIGVAECHPYQEIGDDYELDIATEYFEVTTFRFIGGFDAGTGSRMRITFYDSQGRLVEDTITEPSFAPGNLLRTVIFSERPVIPAQGFVALRPAVESPSGLDCWMSTDTVSVGYNDPNVMSLNSSPSPNILTPDPGILAFEIIGEELGAPLGACCDAETGICELKLPWICEEEGGLFQGIGTHCNVCLDHPFTLCDTDDDCELCIGGDHDGEPCLDDTECEPGGVCNTNPQCVWVPPACQRTACCDPNSGACTEVTGGLCSTTGTPCLNDLECPEGQTCEAPCPGGTYSSGFGTRCVPNCCEQPIYAGGDTCAQAMVHIINVPFPGEDPVTITITGDNKQATFGDYESGTCDLEIFNPDGGIRDRGWWEAFCVMGGCFDMRIDMCCTQEMTGEIHEPQWAFLMTDCDPCTTTILPKPVSPPIGTGTAAYGRGAPFCKGDDMWQTYAHLPGGHHHLFYPIYTAPGGHFGQYQLHVTVAACDMAACCLPTATCIPGTENEGQPCERNSDCDSTPEFGDCKPDCEPMNQTDCDDADGYWLGRGNIPEDMQPVVICEHEPWQFQACGVGSCCVGPGECEDRAGVQDCDPANPETCMDKELCEIIGGVYAGGAMCDWPESPCPVCDIAYESNCQTLSESGARVVMSDLSAAPNGVVHAADFIPEGDTIEQICVWGTYLDASAPRVPTFTGAEQYDCTGMVEDNFRVRVYDDDGGLPDWVIAESSIAEWEVYRAPLRGSGFESLYGIEMLAYTLLLDPPIYLEVGVTHWLEVANDTSEPQGNTCNWHWAVADDAGNGYCADGTGDGYIAGSEQSVDLAFCLGGPGGTPLNFTAPDAPTGSCCDCTDTCIDNVTFVFCQEDFSGIWHRGWDCSNPLACFNEGDDCETDRIPITDGIYPFDTTCATTDGPETVIGEQGLFAFGKDIWFEYTATSTGRLLASLCASGIQYDAAIAVYHDFENPAQCACPCTSNAYQINPASNEGCNGIIDGGAGIIKDIIVFAGECWLIRVGGTGPTAKAADSGRGILEVLCEAPSCFQSSTPQPERLPLPGDPINQKMRYLSFSAGDPGKTQAVRVTFVNLPAPYDTWNGVVMWVQEPTTYCENAGLKVPPCPEQQPATDFLGAALDCAPWWGDFYSAGVVHVFHEGIVPGAAYVVQVVDSTCDPGQESGYSDALWMTTSVRGDVVNNCTTCPCGPPDGVVGLHTDVTAVLDKSRNMEPPQVSCAPVTKARADLAWETPNQLVDISDVTFCMDAFRGVQYPPPWFAPPGEPPCGGPMFVCGNDILEPGEQCDDGNRIPGDGCDENCMSELCGNGAIDGGEECDDGLDNSDTEPDACRTDCTLPRCGDDVVDSGEQCDDGNTTPDDGCDENCQIEPFVGDAVVSLVPVSSSDPGATIVEEENKIELSSGGHQVFLNIRVSDWDPGATGLLLKAWQVAIDSTGYASGLQGTLTPYAPACVGDDDCVALMGPLGQPWGGAKGGCGATGWPAGECIPAWIDNSRTDYILGNTSEGAAVDVSTLDFRYGSTASAFSSPGIAELYAGTLAVDVPVDAAGTFIIDFRRGAGDTCLIDRDNYLIPLGGIEPALITVPAELQPPGPEDSGYGTCVDDGDCPNMPCAGGKCYVTKNRYISFVPGNPGKQTALRVTLFQLPEEFDEFTGLKMWVDQPQAISENGGKIVHTPGWPDFMGANLECPPNRHCMDWSTAGLLHVTDDEIVPDAVYHVQAIDCAADPHDEGNYTAPLVIPTGKWGDICGAFVDGQWKPPDGSVDVPKDVTVVLDKFRNLEGVPNKARADLEPNLPDWLVNISDATYVLDAFRGFAYPPAQTPQPPGWTGPTGCP